MLQPGQAVGWTRDGSTLTLTLPPPDAAQALAGTLRPVAAEYAVDEIPDLRVKVEQPVIRNPDGNEVRRIR